MGERHLFTSEAVCVGHPDKIADQISDAVLDGVLKDDPEGRVACETMVQTGLVIVGGEITTKTYVDVPGVVRETIKEIGYDSSEKGFDFHTCGVLVMIDKQSTDIKSAVDADTKKSLGAGDQGIMFGYACNDTPSLMPLPIDLARRMTWRLKEAREKNEIAYLRPDGKTMVTVEYEGNTPKRVHTVLVSTQHADGVTNDQIRTDVIEKIIKPCIPAEFGNKDIKYLVNTSGRFVIGGPHADCGLTGRKLIADTYGGMGHHGGGSFSGKDPTKVDRSATYAARHAAKNIVAAGLAARCEVQLSYAIGVAEPVSIFVETFGTGKVSDDRLVELLRKNFDFTPSGLIQYYNLRRPIYKQTARFGHFGIDGESYTWERTEKVDALRKAL
jgi:S-adenosylmethionine synthetase